MAKLTDSNAAVAHGRLHAARFLAGTLVAQLATNGNVDAKTLGQLVEELDGIHDAEHGIMGS